MITGNCGNLGGNRGRELGEPGSSGRGQSPNSDWQGDRAALLDVDQRYTTIPLCNVPPRQNPSHRIFIPQNQ